MLVLKTLIDGFTSFYDNLSNDNRLIFFILLFLLLIIVVVIIMLIDNNRALKRQFKVNQAKKEAVVTKEEKGNDVLGNEIDEDNEKTRNLKEITDKLQAVLNSRDIEVTKFEREQEESSIISYDELVKAAAKPQDAPIDKPQEVSTVIEPVVAQPVINQNVGSIVARKIEANEPIKEEIPPTPIREERFRNSAFISPIYGIQDNRNNTSTVNSTNNTVKTQESKEEIIILDDVKKPASKNLESTEKLYDEDEFLMNLKQFRDSLN